MNGRFGVLLLARDGVSQLLSAVLPAIGEEVVNASAVFIRWRPPCPAGERALSSVLLRACLGAIHGSGDGVFGTGAAAAVG